MIRSTSSSIISCLLLIMFASWTSCPGDINYVVKFIGAPSDKTLKTLKSVSSLVSLKSRPPASITTLRRRAEADIPQMIQVLHSQGYYDAHITMDVEEHRQRSATVTVDIDIGPVYLISAFLIRSITEHPDTETPLMEAQLTPELTPDPLLDLHSIPLDKLGIRTKQPAVTKDILKAQTSLIEHLACRGYPLAQLTDQENVADQARKTLHITLYVNSGPQVAFGPTNITGLQRISEELVRRKITWTEGDLFSPSKIKDTQESLEKTRLFSNVNIVHAEQPDTNHFLPMEIRIAESKHRSIGGGISYTTNVGPGIAAEWEHRNIGGKGERLTLRGEADPKDHRGSISYRKPEFLQRHQDLLWTGEYEQERTTQTASRRLEVAGIIERECNPQLKFSYGASVKSIWEQKPKSRTETLLTAPFKGTWNFSDCILDPTSGAIIKLWVTPQTTFDAHISYIKNQLAASVYRPLTSDNKLVFAGQITLGGIIGVSQANVPSLDVFKAGSESLLRGYKHKTVTPLSKEEKTLGKAIGRSMLITNLEMRLRAGKDIGLVGFFEMGNVYTAPLPNFKGDLLKSAGFGIRYHTLVGPIRLDFAFPLDRRKGTDHVWEMYLNIGQAF